MNPMGHRYQCETCGSEAIVTKPGDGSLMCCGKRMSDLTQTELDALEGQNTFGAAQAE